MKIKQRRVGDTLQVTTGGMFPLTFRRVGGTYWWVTKCGQHCISDKFPTVITTLTRNPHVPYISCGKDNHMHVMVARAWVYNPCPHRFHWVDHIDGDKQNNHASNLRWVSPSLNGLNKERDYSGTKKVKKYKSGKVGVYYKTTVTIHGNTETITRGSQEELENACKHKINETFFKQYNDDVASYPTPERADFLSYWQDNADTPLMRPGFIDPPAERSPKPREASFIV